MNLQKIKFDEETGYVKKVTIFNHVDANLGKYDEKAAQGLGKNLAQWIESLKEFLQE